VYGDTAWMRIWLKEPYWLREKLRLRGIDCPELDTPEGRAAKRFVEAQFKLASRIVVTTTKPDKWDRYLSDIFLRQPGGADIFLNNLLLQCGHAIRKEKVAPSDRE
jgi:endonuclease YncB( thermonuclease family)